MLLHLRGLYGSATGLRNAGGRSLVHRRTVLRCRAYRWTIRLRHAANFLARRSKMLVLHAITGLDVLALLGLIEASGSLRLLAI